MNAGLRIRIGFLTAILAGFLAGSRGMGHTDLGKKNQFIRWTDATTVEFGVRHFFNDLKWVGDGQTFEIHPVDIVNQNAQPVDELF